MQNKPAPQHSSLSLFHPPFSIIAGSVRRGDEANISNEQDSGKMKEVDKRQHEKTEAREGWSVAMTRRTHSTPHSLPSPNQSIGLHGFGLPLSNQ